MIKVCEICGNKFTPYRSTNRFCSKECRAKDENKRYLEIHKKWVRENPEKRKKAWRKYNETHKEIINKKNRENYYRKRDYYLKYQKLEINKINNNARTRAKIVMKNADIKKECFECGSLEKIQIHHIDYKPINNDLSNLIYLCSTCHGKRHRK